MLCHLCMLHSRTRIRPRPSLQLWILGAARCTIDSAHHGLFDDTTVGRLVQVVILLLGALPSCGHHGAPAVDVAGFRGTSWDHNEPACAMLAEELEEGGERSAHTCGLDLMCDLDQGDMSGVSMHYIGGRTGHVVGAATVTCCQCIVARYPTIFCICTSLPEVAQSVFRAVCDEVLTA
jgi:hypothetical protein